MAKTVLSLTILLTIISLSALMGWKMIAPFIWIFLLYGATSIIYAIWHKKKWLRLTLINLSFIFFLLAGAEYVASRRFKAASPQDSATRTTSKAQSPTPSIQAYFDPTTSYSKDYYEPKVHPVLGYRVKPNITANSRKILTNGKTLYDVIYTINSLGLRKTPQVSNKPTGTILFFGGSFIFGEGLQDNETIAAQTALIAKQQLNLPLQTLNFGLHGYGPHQMLSLIESGDINSKFKAKPTNAIYLYIASHIQRSAGDTTWDMAGPKYTLNSNNIAKRCGNFHSANPFNFLFWSDSKSALFLEKAKRHLLLKSKLFQLTKSFGQDKQYPIFKGILLKTHKELKRRYPDCRFDIILWDNNPELIKFLTNNKLNWHKASDIIPDFTNNKRKYIIPYDQHPNALADKLLAEYIVKNILYATTNNREQR